MTWHASPSALRPRAAPLRLERAKQPDGGAALLGESADFVERYLALQDLRARTPRPTLAERVIAHNHCRNRRRDYVATATRYLKTKSSSVEDVYDVILVGAGVHAATFLYSARRVMPKLKALVVEKTSDICSTLFRLGDSLVLNSPTFTKVGLNANIVPGPFIKLSIQFSIQLSDFDELEEGPFPTAKHLHELTTMVFLHADADILFDFDVDDVGRAGGSYRLSSRGRTVRAKTIIVANGMGEPTSTAYRSDRSSGLVVHGDEFIRRSFTDESSRKAVTDKTVAVIGAGDTANSVMEVLLPLVYPRATFDFGREVHCLPRAVVWIGQPAQNIQAYFFANKLRYCHSGGVIEYLWDGDTPFDLPPEVWTKAKGLVRCVPHRLISLTHRGETLDLETEAERLTVDLVIDAPAAATT